MPSRKIPLARLLFKRVSSTVYPVIIITIAFAILIIDPYNLSDYSLSSLAAKNERVEAALAQIPIHQRSLRDAESELSALQAEAALFNTRYGAYISNIFSPDKKFHLPSLLIVLDGKANELNLNLSIRHDMLVPPGSAALSAPPATPGPPGVPNVPGTGVPGANIPPDTNMSGVNAPGVPGNNAPGVNPMNTPGVPGINETPGDPGNMPGVPGVMSPNLGADLFQASDMLEAAIPPPGVTVAVLPLVLNGTYVDIREFVLFLENAGYMEPHALTLTPSLEGITAGIILRVFQP